MQSSHPAQNLRFPSSTIQTPRFLFRKDEIYSASMIKLSQITTHGSSNMKINKNLLWAVALTTPMVAFPQDMGQKGKTLASADDDESISQPQMVTGLHLASGKKGHGSTGSANMGFEYAAGFKRSDEKLQGKTDEEKDPKATMGIDLMAANLKLGVAFGNQNHVHMKFDLLGKLDATTGKRAPALTYGYVHRKISNQIDLKIGKMLVNQGGFNQRKNVFDGYATNHFSKDWLWHDQYSNAVAVGYSARMVKATLQLLNKPVRKVNTELDWLKNEESNLDVAIQVEGDVGRGLKPLVQYVAYDESRQPLSASVSSKTEFLISRLQYGNEEGARLEHR